MEAKCRHWTIELIYEDATHDPIDGYSFFYIIMDEDWRDMHCADLVSILQLYKYKNYSLKIILRLCYRAYRVLSKPINELVSLLNLDIPVTPCTSILFIGSSGVLLHVKLPDHRATSIRCFVLVNGICGKLSGPNIPKLFIS